MKTFEEGQTDGQKHLIYILHGIMEGYIRRGDLSQEDMDAPTWDKFQIILNKLEV